MVPYGSGRRVQAIVIADLRGGEGRVMGRRKGAGERGKRKEGRAVKELR